MVTSDDPTAANGKVGYYKTEAYSEPISKYGAVIFVPNGTVLPYVGTKTMTGFRFFNNTSGFNLFNGIG